MTILGITIAVIGGVLACQVANAPCVGDPNIIGPSMGAAALQGVLAANRFFEVVRAWYNYLGEIGFGGADAPDLLQDRPFWRPGGSPKGPDPGPTWKLRPGVEYPVPREGQLPTMMPGEGPSVWGEPFTQPGFKPQWWWQYSGGNLPPGINLTPTPATGIETPISPTTGDPIPHYVLSPDEPMSLEDFQKLLESMGPWTNPKKPNPP
jgi:hypothetical protein